MKQVNPENIVITEQLNPHEFLKTVSKSINNSVSRHGILNVSEELKDSEREQGLIPK